MQGPTSRRAFLFYTAGTGGFTPGEARYQTEPNAYTGEGLRSLKPAWWK